MSETTNRQVRLASRPKGWVTPENFDITEEPVGDPGDGQILVRNLCMSVDPYMRGRMNDAKSYVEPFGLNEVMQAGVVGQVIASNNEGFAEGDVVTGMLGWEQYSVSDGEGVRKVDAAAAPISWHLGVLGMPGLTAWAGLMDVAKLQEGENVFISAASGAVGSVAGQIAKIHGCHVAGCAGSDEKLEVLKDEFGYDAAFNYKKSDSIAKSVAEVCPSGIDVNFENVGGEIFEAALWNMRPFGRIALCGMISNYNDAELQPGPRGMASIIGKRLTIRGFIVTDHAASAGVFAQNVGEWIKTGKLKYRETVTEGIENAPNAFIDMLKGGNIGKQIVKIADL